MMWKIVELSMPEICSIFPYNFYNLESCQKLSHWTWFNFFTFMYYVWKLWGLECPLWFLPYIKIKNLTSQECINWCFALHFGRFSHKFMIFWVCLKDSREKMIPFVWEKCEFHSDMFLNFRRKQHLFKTWVV